MINTNIVMKDNVTLTQSKNSEIKKGFEEQYQTRCVCETQMPLQKPFFFPLKTVTLIFNLDR